MAHSQASARRYAQRLSVEVAALRGIRLVVLQVLLCSAAQSEWVAVVDLAS